MTREGAQPTAIRTRSVVIGLAVGIPVSLLFLWLAVRGVSFDDVWRALSEANMALVLLAVPCLLALFVSQGLRWRHLVEAPEVPRRSVFVTLVFVGTAITNVVPGRPGDVARGVWLSRLGRIPAARSLTSVGVDRMFDVITAFVLLLACLPFVPRPQWLTALVIVGTVVCILGGVLLLAAWLFVRSRGGPDAADSVERGNRSWLRHQASGIVRGLAVFSRPTDVGLALAWSFGGWLINICGSWLIATSLGLGIDFTDAMLVTTVLALGSAIPSSPGMIGTFQWLSVASMGVVGVGKADALAFSILLQAAWYIPTTLSGVPGAWWLTRQAPRTVASA
jgi:uncharacterized protein (TIRG00374 family)